MVTTAGAAVRRFLGEIIRSAYHPRREMRAFRHFRSSSSPGGMHEAIAVPGPLHPVDVHGVRSFEDLDHRVAVPIGEKARPAAAHSLEHALHPAVGHAPDIYPVSDAAAP